MCNCRRELLLLLLDIYSVVITACSAAEAAAFAVIGYTDHLNTLLDFETIADSSCPSSMLLISANFKS